MLNKIAPLLFMAATIALVPQFLEKNEILEARKTQESVQKQRLQTQPQQTAHYATGQRQVRLKADASGHFVTSFKINGRKIEGLIDTGATYIAINSSMAHSIGIRLAASDFKYRAETANGVARAALARVSHLSIDAINVKNIEVFVLEDKGLSTALIGMNFLSRLSSFQVKNSELILTQ